MATGAVGPTNPPAHPLAHLECELANMGVGPAWRGLELPFIGYAPGLVGVYQVNVKIPADWPTDTAYLDCYSGGQIKEVIPERSIQQFRGGSAGPKLRKIQRPARC